jgi:hypothetical protein
MEQMSHSPLLLRLKEYAYASHPCGIPNSFFLRIERGRIHAKETAVAIGVRPTPFFRTVLCISTRVHIFRDSLLEIPFRDFRFVGLCLSSNSYSIDRRPIACIHDLRQLDFETRHIKLNYSPGLLEGCELKEERLTLRHFSRE